MIDQVLEAREYISGRNIVPENMFRICYMMAKLMLEDGLDPIHVRTNLHDWGKKNGIYFKFNVNDAIAKAHRDKARLRRDVDLWISKEDVSEIVSRFDSRIVRCTALAMLCLSKVSTHKNREFAFPIRWLAAWLGEKSRSTYHRAVSELIMFGYLSVVDQKRHSARWNKGTHHDGTVYRVVPDVTYGQDYQLSGNDIWKLYNIAFDGK